MFASYLKSVTTGQIIRPLTLLLPEVNKCFHTNVQSSTRMEFSEPKVWPTYNDKIYPPQSPEESRRPAYVCHMKTNIKYSPKKMWYVASFIRGMSVDEALAQLQFIRRKGAIAVREAILEAQELAVKEHNVEFKSNLWVAESFVGKGYVIKGIRRHAKVRIGIVHYRYCHYLLRLEEGPPPPKDKYYWKESEDGESQLTRWLDMMRNRKVISSL